VGRDATGRAIGKVVDPAEAVAATTTTTTETVPAPVGRETMTTIVRPVAGAVGMAIRKVTRAPPSKAGTNAVAGVAAATTMTTIGAAHITAGQAMTTTIVHPVDADAAGMAIPKATRALPSKAGKNAAAAGATTTTTIAVVRALIAAQGMTTTIVRPEAAGTVAGLAIREATLRLRAAAGAIAKSADAADNRRELRASVWRDWKGVQAEPALPAAFSKLLTALSPVCFSSFDLREDGARRLLDTLHRLQEC
jgi:hypothetical protein